MLTPCLGPPQALTSAFPADYVLLQGQLARGAVVEVLQRHGELMYHRLAWKDGEPRSAPCCMQQGCTFSHCSAVAWQKEARILQTSGAAPHPSPPQPSPCYSCSSPALPRGARTLSFTS